MDLLALVPAIHAARLHTSTLHGEAHWQRVAGMGRLLAGATPGADPLVVALFALFHDSQRLNDGHDPEHGARGAALAATLVGADLDPWRRHLLHEACCHHTDGTTAADPTIGCCWDADRLDLGRVGIPPRAQYLSTAAARAILMSAQGRRLAIPRLPWATLAADYAADLATPFTFEPATGFAWPDPAWVWPGQGYPWPERGQPAPAGDAPLPVQLHVNRVPLDLAAVQPVTDRRTAGVTQPLGGLFTATWNPERGNTHYWLVGWLATVQPAAQRWLRPYLAAPVPADLHVLPMQEPMRYWAQITPDPAARVYVVDSYAACVALWRTYSRPGDHAAGELPRYLSFEAMLADGWDALHVPGAVAGAPWTIWTMGWTAATLPRLAGFDYEQTLWLRPRFAAVTPISPADVQHPPIEITDVEVGYYVDRAWRDEGPADPTTDLVRICATPAELGQIHGWMLAEQHALLPFRRAYATDRLTDLVIQIRRRAGTLPAGL